MTHWHSVSVPAKIKPSPSLFIIWVLNEMFTGLFVIAQVEMRQNRRKQG